MTDYFPLGRITKRFSVEEREERKKAGIRARNLVEI